MTSSCSVDAAKAAVAAIAGKLPRSVIGSGGGNNFDQRMPEPEHAPAGIRADHG